MDKVKSQWRKAALAVAMLLMASACSSAIDGPEADEEGQSGEAAELEGKSDGVEAHEHGHDEMPEPDDVVVADPAEVEAHMQNYSVEPEFVVEFEEMVAVTFSEEEGVALTVLAHKESQEPVGSLLVGVLDKPTYKFEGGTDQQLAAHTVPDDYQGQAALLHELWRERQEEFDRAPGTGSDLDAPEHAHPSEDAAEQEYDTRRQGLSQNWQSSFCYHSGYRYSTHTNQNGCSWSPDGWWGECCDMHDWSYFDGGNAEGDRYTSDYYLIKHCLDRQNGPGQTYFDAVRSFGSSAYNWWNGSCYAYGDEGYVVNGLGRYHSDYWYSLDNYDQLRMCGYYY